MAIITGCSNSETLSSKKTKTETEKTYQGKPLLIGLIPERNIFEQIERYKPLAEYLSKETGINIKLKVLTRYGNIIDNFLSVGIDGAFFGSFVYTLAHAKLGIEVIARPESIEGISTYHGLVFVRKNNGIKTAKDMKGKIFAFVDKAVTAGYLLPLAYFKENGIKDYRTYLKETYFSGTHEGVIYDVLNKKADIGAAKNTEFYRLADIDSRIKNELIILKRSPDVPENGFAVRKDLDISIKNKLKEALLNMHNVPDGRIVLSDFGAHRFIVTTDDDYVNVYKYAKEINLDLTTYDYMND
ncbi:MAG: phosphate/phosphite/phosphonate ABC transporter substrate-binding protein [Nitrospirota bacterium]